METLEKKLGSVINDDISRDLYEYIISTSSFDHAAPREDLTRSQDIAYRWGWCIVHNGSFRPGGHSDRERLVSVGICGRCEHWLDSWRDRNKENVARIAGHHYRYGKHLTDVSVSERTTINDLAKAYAEKTKGDRYGLGMGGRVVVIRYFDGRVVITNDLWAQGQIPADFAELLPNNAEFLEV